MPYYPSGKRGRPPNGIEIMLRMYLLQIWFNLSDEGTEDAIYDSYAMRKFVGINFLEEDVPDATTLLKFRRLLEQHGLTSVSNRFAVSTSAADEPRSKNANNGVTGGMAACRHKYPGRETCKRFLVVL